MLEYLDRDVTAESGLTIIASGKSVFSSVVENCQQYGVVNALPEPFTMTASGMLYSMPVTAYRRNAGQISESSSAPHYAEAENSAIYYLSYDGSVIVVCTNSVATLTSLSIHSGHVYLR